MGLKREWGTVASSGLADVVNGSVIECMHRLYNALAVASQVSVTGRGVAVAVNKSSLFTFGVLRIENTTESLDLR